MDYRAAATRQLSSKQQQPPQQQKQQQQQKLASPQTKQQPKQSGRESPRMKPNSSNSRANSSGGPTNGNKKSSNNVLSSPLSYAATAKKPTSAATSGRKQPTPPLVSLVGSRISLTLVNDNVVEGELFTYDVYSGVIVVSAAAATDLSQKQNQQPLQNAQIHLIKAFNVKDLQLLSTTTSGEDEQRIMPVDQLIQPLDTSIIEARKQRVLVQAQQKASRIGVGVSEKAQTVFEALSKTLPCRWNKEKIVVLDEVVINPPYRVDDCQGLTSTSSTSLLSRVKMVLQGELGRLGHVG